MEKEKSPVKELPVKVENEPNIAFVGKRTVLDKETNKPKEIPAEVPVSEITPRSVIKFPKDVQWGKGFYLKPEDAEYLKQVYRSKYKNPNEKGVKAND